MPSVKLYCGRCICDKREFQFELGKPKNACRLIIESSSKCVNNCAYQHCFYQLIQKGILKIAETCCNIVKVTTIY